MIILFRKLLIIGERCIKQIDKNPIDNSNIIKGVANENIVLPSSISEFEVKMK